MRLHFFDQTRRTGLCRSANYFVVELAYGYFFSRDRTKTFVTDCQTLGRVI